MSSAGGLLGMGSGEGSGMVDLTGVLSTELGASGLAMVNLPVENGCSTDIEDLRSTDLRGPLSPSAGFARNSISSVGGLLRFVISDLRESTESCSCGEGRGTVKDPRESLSKEPSVPLICCHDSSTLPTDPTTTFAGGFLMMLNFFTILPSTLPRFSFFSTGRAITTGAELFETIGGSAVDRRLGYSNAPFVGTVEERGDVGIEGSENVEAGGADTVGVGTVKGSSSVACLS